ncbi:MAG: transposase [Acidobacteria bacterium]|nr:transposase [Acidobacteriota bacterium]
MVNPHVHLLVLDGVFGEEEDSSLRFHSIRPPVLDEVAQLARTINHRLSTMLRRRGLLREDDSPQAGADRPDALQSCIQLALGPGHRERHGQALTLAVDEPQAPLEKSRPLCATDGGVNIHAGVVVAANDDEALARLVRYLLRPPFSLQRFSLRDDLWRRSN